MGFVAHVYSDDIFAACRRAQVVFFTMYIFLQTFSRHVYLFFVMILVMACRIKVPAFSTSFLESPFVMHTFRAGRCVYTSDFAPEAAAESAFARVTRTP